MKLTLITEMTMKIEVVVTKKKEMLEMFNRENISSLLLHMKFF